MSRPSAAQTLSSSEESTFLVDRQHSVAPENPDHIGLQEVVAKLRPDRRELINLVYFGGYTHEEAAEALNLPLGTVKTRIRSALQELKTFFSR